MGLVCKISVKSENCLIIEELFIYFFLRYDEFYKFYHVRVS